MRHQYLETELLTVELKDDGSSDEEELEVVADLNEQVIVQDTEVPTDQPVMSDLATLPVPTEALDEDTLPLLFKETEPVKRTTRGRVVKRPGYLDRYDTD